MAVTKKIEIDGNPVEFKASAAIPRIYRNKFGRDVYKDLMVLNDAIKDGEITDEAMAAKWELTKEGETNVFYLNLAEPVAAGMGFKVADANWANINLGKNSETDPDPLMLELPYTLVPNGENIAIDEEWSGSVVLNLDTYEITFSNEKYEPAQGGVANMAVENGEAVYFNLQGVRVNAPENGIYIVVKDGKAMKVVK